MNIKCPNCQTSYTVPSEKIGDKPKRMRCARCKEVFTVKRRSQRTPYGYEEFTGKQQALPPEFAFLKASIPPPAPQGGDPSAPPEPAPAPPPRDDAPDKGAAPQPAPEFSPQGGPPPVPTSVAREKTSEEKSGQGGGFDYEDFDTGTTGEQPFSEGDFDEQQGSGEAPPSPAPEETVKAGPGDPSSVVSIEPISIVSMEPEAVSISVEPEAVSIPVESSETEPASAETTEAAQEGAERNAPGTTPQQASVKAASAKSSASRQTVPQPMPASPVANGIGDIYSNSVWETEAPLDLASFEFSIPPPPAQSQKIGKIIGISTGVFFLLLLFVMIRNDWSLSLAEFPSQVAFAFSGGTLERLPDTVKELEATVDESRRLMPRGGKGTLLVVKGLVFNNDVIPHSHVELRGRLIDEAGEVRTEMRFACDKFFDDKVLREVADGQVPGLYKKGDGMHNCLIARDSQSSYWLVFEGIPVDYNSSFTVEVTPVAAQ